MVCLRRGFGGGGRGTKVPDGWGPGAGLMAPGGGSIDLKP